MDTNILLENGTNELEVLEFMLNDNHYGINVAKIREILAYQPVTPVPNSQPSVEGIFMPRDAMITVINLKNCLSLPHEGEGKGLFIITNFNMLDLAFHVDAVIGIYTNLNMNVNGQEAWNKLVKYKEEGTLEENVHCIITDIEMPIMDGHRLTKLIKDDREFKHLPLIIFSSLITEEMRRKGKELGADEQMSKPEIGHLVRVIDHLLGVNAK